MSESTDEWNPRLRQFLKDCREISELHFKRWRQEHGKGDAWNWPIADQLCHMHSEVSEAYDVVRRDPTNYKAFCDEIADCIYSAITAYHVAGFDDDTIMRSLSRTFEKNNKRVNIVRNETV